MPNEGRKKKASSVINNALRDGKITKPSRCADCGKEGRKLQAHHTGSSMSRVKWVCGSCHQKNYTSKGK